MPSDCTLCGVRCNELLCRRCEASLPRAAHDSTGIACFEYRFPVDALLRRYKYAGDLAIGRWLAVRLARRVAREPRVDLVVVPPAHRTHLSQRGFNQALEVAKVVARRRGLRRAARAIERVRETPAQQGLGRGARRRNVRGAFRCAMPVAGLSVAIVDDVITTGATVGEIARVLRRAGARDVRIWALARTPLGR